MASTTFIGASIANYKAVKLSPGLNSATKPFAVGLGTYLLSFPSFDAAAIVAAWSASLNELFREITATLSGGGVLFTHTTAGQDFELTVTVDGVATSVASDVQRLVFLPTPTGGTFTLTDGVETTGAITYSTTLATTATNIQNAIIALTAYSSGDVVVTVDGTAFLLTFGGNYTGLEVPLFTGNFVNLTGGNADVAIATLQEGSAGQHEIFTISFPGNGTHTETVNEIQRLTPAGLTAGSFTLTVPTFPATTSLSWNAGRTAIKSALEAVAGYGNFRVTGGPLAVQDTPPTTTEVVAFSSNDGGYKYAGGGNPTSWDAGPGGFSPASGQIIQNTTGGGQSQTSVWRFVLNVSHTDTITSAGLQINITSQSQGLGGADNVMHVRLYAIDGSHLDPAWPADVTAFETALSNRLAYDDTTITGTDVGHFSLNATNCINACIARSGWTSGNHILLVVEAQPTNLTPPQSRGIMFDNPSASGTANDPQLKVAVQTSGSSTISYYPVDIEFIGALAGTNIGNITVTGTGLGSGTITRSTVQDGGTVTVSNIRGGTMNLRLDTVSAGSFSVTAPYNVSASALESLIDPHISSTVTGGPAPASTLTVEINSNEPVNETLTLALIASTGNSVTSNVIRSGSTVISPANVWDITVVPGEGTLGFDYSSPFAYLVLRISEPLTATPVLSVLGASNDIYIRFKDLNAVGLEKTINEFYGQDVVRVTRITHSQEHGFVLVRSQYDVSTQDPIYFWYMKDVYRLVFCNAFAAANSIASITVTTPPLSDSNPTPAGPETWLLPWEQVETGAGTGVGTSPSDAFDRMYESDRVYMGFVQLNAAGRPLHQFSAARYTRPVSTLLSYRTKLFSQYPSGDGSQEIGTDNLRLKRTGIAVNPVDQHITFSWIRRTRSTGEYSAPTDTVLASTPPMQWDASPEEITAALETIFGVGNVLVEGTLYNSFLSESMVDSPTDATTYHDLRITLINKLARLPLTEVTYTLVASINNPLGANSEWNKAFTIFCEPYSVPVPPNSLQRTSFRLSSLTGVTGVTIKVGDTLISVPVGSNRQQIEETINAALGILETPLPAKYLKSATVYGSTIAAFDIEMSGNGYQFVTTPVDVFLTLSAPPVVLAETQTGIAPSPEIQSVSITGSPRRGTFTLTAPAGTTASLSGTTLTSGQLRTALAALTGYSGKITTTGTYPNFVVTFDATLGNLAQMTKTLTGFDNADGSIVRITFGGPKANFGLADDTPGEGPKYWDVPANYSAGVPSSGDSVTFDDSIAPVAFGIRQQSGVYVSSLADNRLKYTRNRSVFCNGQGVMFRGTGTAPAGLTFGTTYYIIDRKNDYTFQLSATPGGSAIDITSVGSGVFELLVVDVVLIVYSRYSGGSIGLPNYRGNSLEYLSRYLMLAGATLNIGFGEGNGLNLLRVDTGNRPSNVIIHSSGQSNTANIPPIMLLFNHADSTLVVDDADVGVGVYFGERSLLHSIEIAAGSLYMDGVTVDTITNTNGADVTLRNCIVHGVSTT